MQNSAETEEAKLDDVEGLKHGDAADWMIQLSLIISGLAPVCARGLQESIMAAAAL